MRRTEQTHRQKIRELTAADVSRRATSAFDPLHRIDPMVRDALVDEISTHAAARYAADRRELTSIRRTTAFGYALLGLSIVLAGSLFAWPENPGVVASLAVVNTWISTVLLGAVYDRRKARARRLARSA